MAENRIAVVGLGYVGLPLAVEFGKKYVTVGFDINQERLAELKRGYDKTLELNASELLSAKYLNFTSELTDLENSNVFIITVPTPIDKYRQPDLSHLFAATGLVGEVLKKGDTVIYESTVYPGATEEDCVPILEKVSGLTFNREFFVGYSPERINPGDRSHRLTDILKVTSGSTPEVACQVDQLYDSIINAGTYLASSIKVAEAAKVIENTQRDVNIGLINEFSLIFERLGIDTEEVLKAAGTKWNFLPFKPGLVGGHCIGVDPYYLTYKAQSVGYHPELILAGRRLNDGMAREMASRFIKAMTAKKIHISEAKVLVMGVTFKENCPDIRNTKVVDVIRELQDFGISVECYDPHVLSADMRKEYDINLVEALKEGIYDGVIIAVGHQEFKDLGITKVRALGKPQHVLFDLKYLFSLKETDIRC